MNFAALDAQNKADGKCTACGGGGVVAAMRVINRTGDVHANRVCPRCHGDGKYRAPKKAPQQDPHS